MHTHHRFPDPYPCAGGLCQGPYLKEAIRRYEEVWLPLISAQRLAGQVSSCLSRAAGCVSNCAAAPDLALLLRVWRVSCNGKGLTMLTPFNTSSRTTPSYTQTKRSRGRRWCLRWTSPLCGTSTGYNRRCTRQTASGWRTRRVTCCTWAWRRWVSICFNSCAAVERLPAAGGRAGPCAARGP